MSQVYAAELKNVSKVYPGVQALFSVNFSIERGSVHSLVGENGSGKSTLIKILSGVENPEPDAQIYLDSVLQRQHNCETALLHGVQVIYQDISLFPNLSVRENITFRSYIHKKQKLVHWNSIDAIARKSLEELGVDIDLKKKVSSLGIAQQQLVEIARSLIGNLKLLILDEPTASLTRKEVNALFSTIERLKKQDVAILFVSHKLNEVFEIAEKITVLRDGKDMGTYPSSNLTRSRLVDLMTGKKEREEKVTKLTHKHSPVLKLTKLSKKGNYADINLELQKGEILGITGLLGSGRTELALSLFGMNVPDSGEVYIDGHRIKLKSNRRALSKGIAYVPENRRDDGLIQEQSVKDNLTLSTLTNYLNKFGLLDTAKSETFVQSAVKDLHIKISSPNSHAKTLSGGNQQKLVFAKWIAKKPKILVLDEPTVGIDIIAKESIHRHIKKMAARGMGIIIISDELRELIHNCHRILVMDHGRIVHECFPEDTEEEFLLKKFNLA